MNSSQNHRHRCWELFICLFVCIHDNELFLLHISNAIELFICIYLSNFCYCINENKTKLYLPGLDLLIIASHQ